MGRSQFQIMISLEGKLLLPTVALMMHYQKMPQISKFFCYLCVFGFIKKIRRKSLLLKQNSNKIFPLACSRDFFRLRGAFYFENSD